MVEENANGSKVLKVGKVTSSVERVLGRVNIGKDVTPYSRRAGHPARADTVANSTWVVVFISPTSAG